MNAVNFIMLTFFCFIRFYRSPCPFSRFWHQHVNFYAEDRYAEVSATRKERNTTMFSSSGLPVAFSCIRLCFDNSINLSLLQSRYIFVIFWSARICLDAHEKRYSWGFRTSICDISTQGWQGGKNLVLPAITVRSAAWKNEILLLSTIEVRAS